MDNQIQKIFNNSKKLYQWVTTKSIITTVYYLFLFWLVTGIIFLCLGLALETTPTTRTILIIISLCVLILGLVIFYIFEFIRRKALHFFQTEFNFKTLFNDVLMKNQITTSSMLIDSEFDAAFYKLHFEYAKNTHEFATLSSNYATYIMYTKIGMMHFSHCNANVIDQKAALKTIQFIVTTQSDNKAAVEQTLKNQNAIYYYKLLNNLHCYCFSFPAKQFVIQLNGVKFYRQSWQSISDLYEDNVNVIQSLIKTIQSQQ